VGLLCLAPVPEFAEWTAPNKLMDLLAAGLPVASNLSGAAARLLAEGGCGVTSRATDAADFARLLAAFAERPANRIAMGAASRRLAERRFDRRLLAGRFVAAVEGAMAARPRGATLAGARG
jgi:glycosyltransferase involved in cell wall biosynthesis